MSLILVTGATGRHGGTGAHVACRLQQEGHQVRVLVRMKDERSEALEAAGFDVRFGDLRDRASLLPAMQGIEQATFCFPIDAGIVEAAASFASALKKEAPAARVVVMSMVVAQESSPTHLGRAQWLAEEVMASFGLRLSVLRVAAMFYENVLFLHRDSIRERGVLRNCFGEVKTPWIAGDDAGELMLSALLHPERFGQQIVYTPGAEVLSHDDIARVLSSELGRPVRYESISREAWQAELLDLTARDRPVLNANMARHISAVGAALAHRGGAQKAPVAGDLAQLMGRAPTSFRDFVRARRGDFAK
ncbi:MAG: NmrA family NAD(P)-binding protein [Kofleriaceae bacterium]